MKNQKILSAFEKMNANPTDREPRSRAQRSHGKDFKMARSGLRLLPYSSSLMLTGG